MDARGNSFIICPLLHYSNGRDANDSNPLTNIERQQQVIQNREASDLTQSIISLFSAEWQLLTKQSFS